MGEQDHGCIEGLADQVALITGATRGIGLATARMLGRYGARLVVSSRDRERGESTRQQLEEELDAPVLAVTMDVSSRREVGHALERALGWTSGRLDIVINNAGYPVEDRLWNTPMHQLGDNELTDAFNRVYRVDVAGARNVTHAALPVMMQQGRGSIVFVSSTPALAGHKATPYTEAKACVLGLMRDVALNYGEHNIRANAVAPGNIRTIWSERLSEDEQQQLAREAALRRWGEAEEVARAILFLASPLSSFVTGQTLVIDGGRVFL